VATRSSSHVADVGSSARRGPPGADESDETVSPIGWPNFGEKIGVSTGTTSAIDSVHAADQ